MTDAAPRPALRLGDKVPDFEAKTTHGTLKLSDYAAGHWLVLFSHPADFTPVCTTEFAAFARKADEFAKRKVKLIGNSIDSVFSHIAWVRSIERDHGVKVDFPVVADLDQKVARAYGMVHEPVAETATVRCVFVIDPKLTLRALIYYPLNVGRNIDEVLRLLDGLQTADKNGVACPANWKPGEDVIVPPPQTQADAEKRVTDKGLTVTDWYFSKKKL